MGSKSHFLDPKKGSFWPSGLLYKSLFKRGHFGGHFWGPKRGQKGVILAGIRIFSAKSGTPKVALFATFGQNGQNRRNSGLRGQIGCSGGGPKWGQQQAKKGHFGPPLLYKSRKRAILTPFGPFWGSKKGSFLDPDLATSR